MTHSRSDIDGTAGLGLEEKPECYLGSRLFATGPLCEWVCDKVFLGFASCKLSRWKLGVDIVAGLD
jgi:hypothetical protein